MPERRTAPLSPTSVVGALSTQADDDSFKTSVPKTAGPMEVSAGDPPPGRDPSYGVEMPEPVTQQESRIIRPETLTRKYDEAERRIRRQVSQQMERGVRVLPPVNISALEKGGYTTTSGSRVGYDLKRFQDLSPQGTNIGESQTARGGGAVPTTNTRVGRGGPPVDATGSDLLDRYQSVPGVDDVRRGVDGGRSRTNPRGLLDNAARMARGRAF